MTSTGVPGLLEELNTLNEVNSDKVYLQELVYYLEDDKADLERENSKLKENIVNAQFWKIMSFIPWCLVGILIIYIRGNIQ